MFGDRIMRAKQRCGKGVYKETPGEVKGLHKEEG
jgi:hypothetical protein